MAFSVCDVVLREKIFHVQVISMKPHIFVSPISGPHLYPFLFANYAITAIPSIRHLFL